MQMNERMMVPIIPIGLPNNYSHAFPSHAHYNENLPARILVVLSRRLLCFVSYCPCICPCLLRLCTCLFACVGFELCLCHDLKHSLYLLSFCAISPTTSCQNMFFARRRRMYHLPFTDPQPAESLTSTRLPRKVYWKFHAARVALPFLKAAQSNRCYQPMPTE